MKREMDRTGLDLCNIQGKIFEQSITHETCSSNIFIRRFMNSSVVKRMDNLSFMNETTNVEDVFDEINEEYGESDYGKIKFHADEMYWMGYIYRYGTYVYQSESWRIYKIIKGNALRKLYYGYHTLDPMKAFDRILEAKNIDFDKSEEEKIAQGVKVLRRIREEFKE